MSKYNAVPTYVDGYRFASKAEARRYEQLKLLVKAGVITHLELQPKYILTAGISYIADFCYYQNGKPVAEDVKGKATEVFKLKAKLFHHCYPSVELRIIPANEV